MGLDPREGRTGAGPWGHPHLIPCLSESLAVQPLSHPPFAPIPTSFNMRLWNTHSGASPAVSPEDSVRKNTHHLLRGAHSPAKCFLELVRALFKNMNDVDLLS